MYVFTKESVVEFKTQSLCFTSYIAVAPAAILADIAVTAGVTCLMFNSAYYN